MSNDVIKVLVVEDSDPDYRLIEEYVSLSKDLEIQLERAERLSSAIARLNSSNFDAVLLDLTLPDSRGRDTVVEMREEIQSVPIVVLSGVEDEKIAVECVSKGAQDYLVKSRVNTEDIVRALRYAIQRHRIQEGIAKARKEFESGEFKAADARETVSPSPRTKTVFSETGPTTLDQETISSYANRLALILRNKKKQNTLSPEIISLQLRGMADRLTELRPVGADVVAIVQEAINKERLSALDGDVVPICFDFIALVVTQYQQRSGPKPTGS